MSSSYAPINLKSRIDAITTHWTPQHVLTLNKTHSLNLATIFGAFIWHSHPETDEMFYCVSGGPFKIELSTQARSPEEAERLGADEVVEVGVGDVFNVLRGVMHRPVAEVSGFDGGKGNARRDGAKL